MVTISSLVAGLRFHCKGAVVGALIFVATVVTSGVGRYLDGRAEIVGCHNRPGENRREDGTADVVSYA